MKVGIIIGSVRQGRVTDRLAKWVESELKKQSGVEVTMIDLIDYKLPMFDEAVSPQFNPDRKTTGVVKSFLDVVDKQDSFVVVTPEYNRSYSSALKNALDYVAYELKRKPVMLVAHGSTGGAQAVSHLRAVFPGLLAVTSPAAVMVNGWLSAMLDEDGKPIESSDSAPLPTDGLTRAIDEFIWLSDSMNKGRKSDTSKAGK